MTCKECIHKAVCYRVDSVKSDYARKCGDFVSGCKGLKQEPCDDAICRAQAIYVASGYCHPANIAKELEKLPSVIPQPKTGWRIAHGMYEDRFWCSCGYIKIIDSNVSEWKYCPVCGAKMAESE